MLEPYDEAARMAAVAAVHARDDDQSRDAFIVWFEDQDHAPAIFGSWGSASGARRYYEAKVTAWSCHLFRKIS